MSFIRKYPLATFFLLVYAIAWLVWGSKIAATFGWISFQLPENLAFFGISISAVMISAIADGKAGINRLFSRLVRWRVGGKWYAIAFFIPAGISLAAIGLHILLGGNHQIATIIPLQGILPLFIEQIIIHLLTEEPGWRGFALSRLQENFTALWASFILGLSWGIWHFPLFLIPGTPQASIPFVGFLLSTIAIAILMTWIYNHTKGSVLLAAFFHAAYNTTLVFFGTLWGDLRVFWFYVAVTWIAAIFVVIIEGAAHLDRKKTLTAT